MRAVYVSAGRAQWLETCRALARLPALHSFVLVLGSGWYSEPVEKLPVFLEPLRGLPIQHSRRNAKDAMRVKREMSRRSSSDDESWSPLSVSSSPSLSSDSSPSPSVHPTIDLRDNTYDCSALCAPATWELRLQGQPYYVHELGRVSEDLRRRGIDCRISST